MIYEHLHSAVARNRRIAYKTWYHMHHRCRTQLRYAEVLIDESWNDFEVFYSDMGDRPSDNHSLDRINGSLIYSKSTCKWSTAIEQAGNRPGFTISLIYQNRPTNLKALCRLLNKSYLNTYRKYRNNVPLHIILGVPNDSLVVVTS